jgi:hypothetical protein
MSRPLQFGEASSRSPHDAFFFYSNNELHGVRSRSLDAFEI